MLSNRSGQCFPSALTFELFGGYFFFGRNEKVLLSKCITINSEPFKSTLIPAFSIDILQIESSSFNDSFLGS